MRGAVQMMTGANMLHVPYRGAAPALADLLGGQVQVCFGGVIASIEYISAGRLRALAVTTASRLEALPDIPSLSELLPGYEATDWKGIGAKVVKFAGIKADRSQNFYHSLGGTDETSSSQIFAVG